MKTDIQIRQGTECCTLPGGIVKGIFITLIMLVLHGGAYAQADGKMLFKQNCGVCHSTTTQKLVGPGLEGINEKRKEDWLLKWIKDSQAFIKSGDPDAKAVFEENNKQVMNPMNLTDVEIKSILAYIKDPKAGEPAQPVAANTAPVQPVQKPFVLGLAAKIALVVAAVLFVVLGGYLWNINRLVTSMGYDSLKIKVFDYPVEEILSRHKIIVAIVCLALIALGVKSCHDSMM